MGVTAVAIRSKRGSPLTRARVLSLVKPCKPPRLPQGSASPTKSDGAKDDAGDWERTLLDEPARKGRELGAANSSGWCRGPVKTNLLICMGKGSTVVEDALNGDSAVPGMMGRPLRLNRVLKNR